MSAIPAGFNESLVKIKIKIKKNQDKVTPYNHKVRFFQNDTGLLKKHRTSCYFMICPKSLLEILILKTDPMKIIEHIEKAPSYPPKGRKMFSPWFWPSETCLRSVIELDL